LLWQDCNFAPIVAPKEVKSQQQALSNVKRVRAQAQLGRVGCNTSKNNLSSRPEEDHPRADDLREWMI